MSEPLPDLPPVQGAPGAWQVCPFCGVVVADMPSHHDFHQALVNRVRAAEDLLAATRTQTQQALAAQKTRIDTPTARVAALDGGART